MTTHSHDQDLTPGFSVIHSNRLEDLRSVAVQWICAHPLAPLENETFLVQSNGMAQWLKLALAQDSGCGISAALDIQLPGRFSWHAYRTVLDDLDIPEASPFDKERLTWRLLRLLPSLMEDRRFTTLKQFLDNVPDQRKEIQLAGLLADLFDQYQVYRADWLEDWAAGRDHLRNGTGGIARFPEDLAWQPELWRRLQTDIVPDRQDISRAGLHRRFLARAASLDHRPAGLPGRIMVFGLSSLPLQVLEVLNAVSSVSQVLLFVHNPCRHYWADIIEDRELLRFDHARHLRKEGLPDILEPEDLHQQSNPLLAAWGKQGRDYIGMLYTYDRPETYQQRFAEIDLFEDVVSEGEDTTLLQAVQQAILDLDPLPGPGTEKPAISRDDYSITFHLAHSRQREVEILQDRLLLMFDRIPGLTPRDIIVMTPDITAYAPHIHAVFGNLQPADPRYIPFTIADNLQTGQIPMLTALETLLNLPDSRFTVSDLMGLLEVAAVRNRFGIAEADLPRLEDWIQGSGIRWGLNAGQRARFGMDGKQEQNTWMFGMNRMLLGYAVGSGDPWNGLEPFDEIGGLDAALIGPLSLLLQALDSLALDLASPAPPEAWFQRIQAMVKSFFLPSGNWDRVFVTRLTDVMETWLTDCNDARFDRELTRIVMTETLLSAMSQSGMSQRFLAGMVNFCTLMPMRAIPFTVVCLLGMNDTDYPRSHPPLDFDLMSGPGLYRPGDRSRREDDRYLFLEALLSARSVLHISYTGRDIHDNTLRMPSVLVGQLQDYLAAGWVSETGRDLMDVLTCRHPLQPFSSRYFSTDDDPFLFTYAHEWHPLANRQERDEGDFPLPPPEVDGNLRLDLLVRFLKNPVSAFFQQRLNTRFDDIDAAAMDREPFALERLAPFGPGKEILAKGLAAEDGHYRETVIAAGQRLKQTGTLPMGGFGELAVRQLADPVLEMLSRHTRLCSQWPLDAGDIELCLPLTLDREITRTVEGWLDNLRQTPDPDAGHCRWAFYPNPVCDSGSRIQKPETLIDLWVRHLAGSAHGLCLTSCLVTPDTTAVLNPMAQETAAAHLETIARLWWQGLSRPLPVTAKTALAFLGSLDRDFTATTPQALAKAAAAYQGGAYASVGEVGYDPCLQRTFPDFESLAASDDNWFFQLARQLYLPLLTALEED